MLFIPKMDWKVLSVLATFVALSTCSLDATFKSGLEQFRQNIFNELETSHGEENIIFSPFAAQTSLAMVRIGADGETAAELDRAMGLSGKSSEYIADNYFSLLSHYEDSNQVTTANKIYVAEGSELHEDFNKIVSDKFFAAAESIDFTQNEKAAHDINTWVDSKTNHLIKNLIDKDVLDADTRMVLLNAIHFKGEWLKPFDEEDTKDTDFYLDETNKVKTPMMNMVARFEYAYLPEIEAEALRLPYKDSDLSMIIILPDECNGLVKAQKKFKDMSLDTVTNKMRHMIVDVTLPKFKAEFTIELTDTLKKLKLEHLFKDANFEKMLASHEYLEITHIIQKAFIEVTEKGTEAAAATAAVESTRMMPPHFNADHPFHYFILNTENVVLFEGTVVKF